MNKQSISQYLSVLRFLPTEKLLELASEAEPDPRGHYRDSEEEALKMLSAAWMYIAELKTPCKPGDVGCIEHRAENCPCLAKTAEWPY